MAKRMRRIGNIQLLSTGKSQKAALWISIVFMVLFWTLITAFLTIIFYAIFVGQISYNIFNVTFIAVILLIDVWLVPLQLVRYFRQLQVYRQKPEAPPARSFLDL